MVDARIRNDDADAFLERAAYRVRRMYPAICIQYIFGYIFRVDAVDRISHVLACRDDQREGHEDHNGDRIVESENRRVDPDVVDFDEILQAAEDVQHDSVPARSSSIVTQSGPSLRFHFRSNFRNSDRHFSPGLVFKLNSPAR
ncbi:unnamed protein product, partial [Nesidiocoris tenuis]